MDTDETIKRKKKITFDEISSTEENIESFGLKVQQIVEDCQCTYKEAIVSYCEEKDIDVNEIVPLIPAGFIAKMKTQELELNTIKEDDSPLLEIV